MIFLIISPVMAQLDQEIDKEIDITTQLVSKTPPPPDNMVLGNLLSITLSILFLLGFIIIIAFIVKDFLSKKITIKEFFKFNKIKIILLLLPILFNGLFLLKEPMMIAGFVFFMILYYIFINILYWVYKKVFPMNLNQFSKIKKILVLCLIVLLSIYFLMGFLVIVKGLTMPKPYVLIQNGEWGVSGVSEKLSHHRYALGWKGIDAIHNIDISIANSKDRHDLVDCYGFKTNKIYETTKYDWIRSNCYLGFYMKFEEFSPGHIA